MKKSIRRTTAIALSTLMAVSAIGGLTASAAEATPHHEYRTFYFVNNKGWSDVYLHVWNDHGKTTQYPGVKLDPVGTTKVINGNDMDVYRFTVDTADYECFNVNTPSSGGCESDNISFNDISWNCFCLNDNTHVVPVYNFTENNISKDESLLKSDGKREIRLDTTNYECAEPTVEFVREDGSVVAATKVLKAANGRYTVIIPEGTFRTAQITAGGVTFVKTLNSKTTSLYIM